MKDKVILNISHCYYTPYHELYKIIKELPSLKFQLQLNVNIYDIAPDNSNIGGHCPIVDGVWQS